MTYIYCLRERGFDTVEYVGKTVFELLVRLDGHYSDVKTGGTSKKAKWIRDVWSRGGEIEISLLCVCSEEQDRKIEEGLIRTYRAINPNLKNGLVKGEPREKKDEYYDIPGEGLTVFRTLRAFKAKILGADCQASIDNDSIIQIFGKNVAVLMSFERWIELKRKAGESVDDILKEASTHRRLSVDNEPPMCLATLNQTI